MPAAPSSASVLSCTPPPSAPGPSCRICPQQSSLRRDRYRETWEAHAGPGRLTWRHQLYVPGCRLPVEARLQLFQQCSPVCRRTRPLCATTVPCCRPAPGQAELLFQYGLKLKCKTSNTRHVMQNLIFDLLLCPTLLPPACSSTSL